MTQWTKPGSYRERAGGKTKNSGNENGAAKPRKGTNKRKIFENIKNQNKTVTHTAK